MLFRSLYSMSHVREGVLKCICGFISGAAWGHVVLTSDNFGLLPCVHMYTIYFIAYILLTGKLDITGHCS